MTRRATRLARVTAALTALVVVSASALVLSTSALAVRPPAPPATSAVAAASWRTCPGASGSGGAFDVRALQVSCRYAARVTGDGLEPSATATRAGAFRCRRTRAADTWRYTCLRQGGRQGLAFRTY